MTVEQYRELFQTTADEISKELRKLFIREEKKEYRQELIDEHIERLENELKELRHTVSWGVSCSGCSNQLAEDWEIVQGSFICRECIDYGGDSV